MNQPHKPTSYCDAVSRMYADNLHKIYLDTIYGFPILDDNELFERLILEINQAGLSWNTILQKQQNFKKAYNQFEVQVVANYGEEDVARLLQDAGIIRNRLKVHAAIHNAQVIMQLQDSHGSFSAWLDHHHPLVLKDWMKLFKKTFKFTGGEIVNEFLMSIGYLDGSHVDGCPIRVKVIESGPRFLDVKEDREG
jgi:DNA-3-methyladenine glycosylase I